MSTFYFIGGAPRTGKTKIIHEVIKQRPLLAASTDAIRNVAKSLASPEDNPRLHKVGRGSFGSEQYMKLLEYNPAKMLDFEIAAAEETWASVLQFVSYYQADDKDAALEGYVILPKELVKQSFNYKAVFFVNLNDQTETIVAHARTHIDDWLHPYSDDVIRGYCQSNRKHNQYYYNEARKYGLPVVLVGKNFNQSVSEAVSLLLS